MLNKPNTPLTPLRVNVLKTSPEDIWTLLDKNGISTSPIEWYEYALIAQCDTRTLTSLNEYKEGYFYIQQLSSMLPALALDVEPGYTVLDLCSAPGSKTTQIAELCQNNCSIVANDISAHRIHKVLATARAHGITSISTTVRAGESYGRTHADTFDKILVDVPCSMGQPYAQKNLKRLIQRQRGLLRSGFRALKPGGTLIYSTCSPRKEENDEVIEWLLKKEESAIIEPLSLQHIPQRWIDNPYIRIQKSETESDFFIAKITK